MERHLKPGSVPTKEKQSRSDNKIYLIGCNSENVSSPSTENMFVSSNEKPVEELIDFASGKEFLSIEKLSSFPATKNFSQSKQKQPMDIEKVTSFLDLNSSKILEK